MDKPYLTEIAKEVDKRLPDAHGFIVLAFPFEKQGDNRLSYISNANREDCIKALKEFFFNIGEKENWMNHIN